LNEILILTFILKGKNQDRLKRILCLKESMETAKRSNEIF